MPETKEIIPEMYAMIEDIAKSLDGQLKWVYTYPTEQQKYYEAAIRDDIVAMAIVVHKYCPGYDMDLFYRQAGYTGTHPVHS